jgi:hypothetical protein
VHHNWRKTAPFTAERHKALGVTSFAPHAQKSVFKAAAFEVLIELALDIPRQCASLRR